MYDDVWENFKYTFYLKITFNSFFLYSACLQNKAILWFFRTVRIMGQPQMMSRKKSTFSTPPPSIWYLFSLGTSQKFNSVSQNSDPPRDIIYG
jgi:hypothetical protein